MLVFCDVELWTLAAVSTTVSRIPLRSATRWRFEPGLPLVRREVLERFERYIRTRADLTSRLPELEGKTLACWCAGKEGMPEILTADDDIFCDGQILLRVLKEYV